jgi:Flp pilus assembly protein TadB
VTSLTLLSLAFAAVLAASLAGLYLAWPREMTAEEWILHRRQSRHGRTRVQRTFALRVVNRDNRLGLRLRWALRLVRADLRLLQLRGESPVQSEEALITSLLRLGALGAGGGFAVGFAMWLVSGRPGLPGSALVLPIACGTLLPGLRWLRLRRQATEARTAIRRRLPRILSGSRVLLESGAVTPQQALSTAVTVYRDSAADVLREALLQQEVRRVELQEALDQVGETYGLDELRRLADAYRVGTKHGTQMADLLTEFALTLRQGEHAAYRERMTRAPVLMAVPALVFFVLPLITVLLLLILFPLESAFGQL